MSTLYVNNTRYYLIERLTLESNVRGVRYKALDKNAGPKNGALRHIHILPRSEASVRYAKTLQRVSKNNTTVPIVLQYSIEKNRVVLVVPWVDGRTLGQVLADSKKPHARRMSAFEAIRLVYGLANGLMHLGCGKALVHGDIKPDNLVVCRNPNRLVIIDFGSAWALGDTVQRLPLDGITRQYASPEALRDESLVDFRHDIFSATAVWYQMLTFRIPYGGLGGQAAAEDRYDDSYRVLQPPSQLSPDRHRLPPEVWALVDAAITKGLCFDKEHRFRSWKQWVQSLRDIRFELERPARIHRRIEDEPPPSRFATLRKLWNVWK